MELGNYNLELVWLQ